jgi:hypothetical protein
MFDKTIALQSTDGSLQLVVVAGTEGLKSLTLSSGAMKQQVTAQQLMDICAPAIKTWFVEGKYAPPSPVAPPSGSSGPVC